MKKLLLLSTISLCLFSVQLYAQTSPEFFKAIKDGNIPAIERLLKLKPTLVNQPDAEGNFPLIFAIMQGKKGIIYLLLQHGALVEDIVWQQRGMYGSVNNIDPFSALSYSNLSDEDQEDIIKALEEYREINKPEPQIVEEM